MKRVIAIILAAVMSLSMAMAACASDTTYPRDPAEEYFGISLPLTNSEYYKGVQDELIALCEEFGIKYDVASADGDSQKQMTQVENFITMGCTTIIIYAIDLKAMEDKMLEAKNEGIRVVSATMTPDNVEAYDIAVDASQEAVGTAAAEYAAAWVDKHYPDAGEGEVECCLFTMSISENALARCDAFDKVEELNSKIKIVEEYDVPMDNYLVKCQEDAELMMQTYPDVKLIITYSDTFNIIIDEVMMANPDVDVSGVCSVAIDRTTACMEKISASANDESTIRATVASGEDFNRTLIEASLGAFDEELNDQKQYFVEPFIIDAENVSQYLD